MKANKHLKNILDNTCTNNATSKRKTLPLEYIDKIKSHKVHKKIRTNADEKINKKGDKKRGKQTSKNLLAFSGGSDSVALFFALIKEEVDFDIAIVDYGIRAQSKAEVAYAKTLAKAHKKRCFVKKAPKIQSNFEANAREFRYEFFENLIAQYGYKNLLLAHHLNDRIEWFFMQFGKGAGLGTMLGFAGIQKREKGLVKKGVKYRIIRPMLLLQKREILGFCKENKLKFFSDSSNFDSAYKRNFMRLNFVNDFVNEFGGGAKKSLALLEAEKNALYRGKMRDFGDFCIIKARNTLEALHCVDKYAKQGGYVISSKQRDEIVRCGFSCEIGGKRRKISDKKAENPNMPNAKKKANTQNMQKCFYDKKGFMLENIGVIFENLANQTGKKIYIFISALDKTMDKKNESLPKDFREFARKSHLPQKMRKPLYAFSSQKNISYQKALDLIIKCFCKNQK